MGTNLSLNVVQRKVNATLAGAVVSDRRSGYVAVDLVGMRNTRTLLCLASALSALLGCGPRASQPSDGDGDGGDETPKNDLGESDPTSTGEATEDTGAQSSCGNGSIDDGEWCFERFAFDQGVLPDQRSPDDDHLQRVARGRGTMGEVFAIFGEQLWEAQYASSGVSFRRYFPNIGVGPETKILAAKLAPEGAGRVDYLFYRTHDIDATCSHRSPVAPGPSRIPPDEVDDYQFSFPTLSELDCDRDGLITPINLDNNGTDWFFGADNDTKLGGLYAYDASAANWNSGPHIVGVAQEIGEMTACRMVHLDAGDIDGDGNEDAVVYGRDCPDGANEQLIVLLGDGQGFLDPTPRAWPLSAQGGVLTMSLEDLDLDGIADIVLVGDGFLQILYGQPEGVSEPSTIDVTPRSFALDQETTVLPVDFADFDGEPGLEILVRTENAIVLASPARGVIFEFEEMLMPTSYAAADINHDGLADVGFLHERSLVFFVSNP